MNQYPLSNHATELQLDASFPEPDVVEHKYVESGYGHKWRIKRTLGSGTFGIVKLQKCDDNGNLRAVKQLENTKPMNTLPELEAIAAFSQTGYRSHFVQSLGWYEDRDRLYIAMEYLELGDLLKYIPRKGLPEPQVKVIMHQLFDAVGFLHEENTAHRDLKPENIMVVQSGPDWKVKIADFGLSKRTAATQLRTLNTGTKPYMAPELRKDDLDFGKYRDEIYNSSEYTFAVDLWSLGIIMYELLTGSVPFPKGKDLAAYIQTKQPFPDYPWGNGRLSKQSERLCRKLLRQNPDDRGSAGEAAAEPW